MRIAYRNCVVIDATSPRPMFEKGGDVAAGRNERMG